MITEKYKITGMTCAACSSAVERVTRKMDGVEESNVNLTTAFLTITYDETKIQPENIIKKIDRAGFGAELYVEQEKKEDKVSEKVFEEKTLSETKKDPVKGSEKGSKTVIISTKVVPIKKQSLKKC